MREEFHILIGIQRSLLSKHTCHTEVPVLGILFYTRHVYNTSPVRIVDHLKVLPSDWTVAISLQWCPLETLDLLFYNMLGSVFC